MKYLISLSFALFSINALTAQFPGASAVANSYASEQSIGFNPNINRNGIALGNHFILNGYANVAFFSKNEDSVTSGSWMDPIMNMIDKETGFNAFAVLDAHVNFQPFSLRVHTNISESIFIEQLFLQYQINDIFSLEAGKFVSNRTIHPEEFNERFIFTKPFHFQQGAIGSRFSIAIMDEILSLVNDAINNADQNSINNLVSIYGIDVNEVETDINSASFDMNAFMTPIAEAVSQMMTDMMLLRNDYKTSYNNGIRAKVSAGLVDISIGLTESIWNQMPDMGEGDIGLDLSAVAYINPSFAAKIGYAYEAVDAMSSPLLKLVIPNSSDDIHHFNSGLEFSNLGFTTSFEYGHLKLNPLDTDVWDIALLIHYQINDLFGLGFLYSHEDLDTPMGDGESDKFNLSLNFNLSDHFLIGLGYSVVEAHLADIDSDLNEFMVNSLYSF